MLSQRLTSLLPPMTQQEAMSTAMIRSICGKPVTRDNWLQRPMQSPHHSVSSTALVGGGSIPKPGEISLAHNGVLFLDELTEFQRTALETLREPLENGEINISRASRQSSFPARFQLIAALNPCPGGCESVESCDCTPSNSNAIAAGSRHRYSTASIFRSSYPGSTSDYCSHLERQMEKTVKQSSNA